MNAREGMQRLRDERRAYGLCVCCGIMLEKGYAFKRCPECLAIGRKYRARSDAKRKAEKK